MARAASYPHVKPGGTGGCTTWVDACTLPTALGQAAYGDEIWVVSGVYTPGTTLTATVLTGVGAPTLVDAPIGVITLTEGAAPVAVATLTDGVATFAVSTLPAGAHTLTAVYGGSANYAASTSASQTVAVTSSAYRSYLPLILR